MPDLSDTQPDEGQKLEPAREPLVVIPGDLDQARGYKVKKWRSFDNYCCLYCQFSSLWLYKMEKHQAVGKHPWAFPGQNPVGQGEVRPGTDPEY